MAPSGGPTGKIRRWGARAARHGGAAARGQSEAWQEAVRRGVGSGRGGPSLWRGSLARMPPARHEAARARAAAHAMPRRGARPLRAGSTAGGQSDEIRPPCKVVLYMFSPCGCAGGTNLDRRNVGQHGGPMHPVRNANLRGSRWFATWYSQACTPWPVIERRAGIAQARLSEFDRGVLPTADEVVALAKLWACPAEQIALSIAESGAGRTHSRPGVPNGANAPAHQDEYFREMLPPTAS